MTKQETQLFVKTALLGHLCKVIFGEKDLKINKYWMGINMASVHPQTPFQPSYFDYKYYSNMCFQAWTGLVWCWAGIKWQWCLESLAAPAAPPDLIECVRAKAVNI